MKKDIQQAIKIFKEGGIVIFPTDTAFGIGCRIDDRKAVDRLFAIRKRPRTQATPVLVASIEQALPYLDSPLHIVRQLMEDYWPGALTIITPCKKEKIYSPIRGGGETVGIRMPDHSDILKVIASVGVAILGPSANIHGEKTPFSFEDLDPTLVRQVDFVLQGVCKEKTVSTVVDCSVDPFIVVRQGAVILSRKTCIVRIDSSKQHETEVVIRIGSIEKKKTIASVTHTSQQVLPLLETLLAENDLKFEDITSIEVDTGPGSFTGLRVGAAIGQTLGLLLGVPVNRKKAGAPIPLDYGIDRWKSDSH